MERGETMSWRRVCGRRTRVCLRGLLALALAGCAVVGVAGATPGAAQDPVGLTMMLPLNMLHTADFVAIEKGFFLRHGLKVKTIPVTTGAEANAGMQAGNAQLTGLSITSIPTARQAGLPVVLVVPTHNDATTSTADNALSIIARADSGIKPDNAPSLVGKRVGVLSGTTSDEYLTRWLTSRGVDPKKVAYINVAPGDHLVTIQSHQIDAIATWEPYGTMILDALGSQAVLIERGGPVLGFTLGIGSTDRYVKDHPEIIQRVADAVAETEAWTRTHSGEAADVATHWVPGLTPKVARDAIRNLDFDPRISGCTLRTFTDSTRILYQQHKLRRMIPTDEQVTVRFIKETEQRFPRYFKDLKPIPASCGG